MCNLLVVDVQPAYHKWCGPIVKKVVQRINENEEGVTVVMFVGDGITPDTEYDVRDYLLENGLNEDCLDGILFVEKDFGFLRGWMDSGISDDSIVSTLRHMIRSNVGSSDAVDSEILLSLTDGEVEGQMESIFRPTFNDRAFAYVRNWETCGGGSDECLREVELWLAANDHQFNRVSGIIY